MKSRIKRQVAWRLDDRHLKDIERNEVASGQFASTAAFVNWLLARYCAGDTIKRGA